MLRIAGPHVLMPVVAGCVLMAACAGTSAVAKPANRNPANGASPSSIATSTSIPPKRPGEIVVPDVIGLNLQAAQAKLSRLGLHATAQDDSGQDRPQPVPSEWHVVAQAPAAGTVVTNTPTANAAAYSRQYQQLDDRRTAIMNAIDDISRQLAPLAVLVKPGQPHPAAYDQLLIQQEGFTHQLGDLQAAITTLVAEGPIPPSITLSVLETGERP